MNFRKNQIISICGFCVFLCLSILIGGCGNVAQRNFVLKGDTKGLEGAKIILTSQPSMNSSDTLGQTVIKDGKFEFSGGLENPVLATIKVPSIEKFAFFWLSNGEIEIILDTDNVNPMKPDLLIPVVKGSRENDLYNEFEKQSEEIYTVWEDLYSAIENTSDPEEKIKIEARIAEMESESSIKYKELLIGFLNKNKNSVVSGYLLNYLLNTSISFDTINTIMNGLSSEVKKTAYYKENEKILTKLINVQPEKPAPDFTLPERDGKLFTLTSLNGNVILLDFWGSWCGPCLASIPELKELYKKYKKDGFEIVGVAQDKRDNWLKALDKFQLEWTGVINDSSPEVNYENVVELYGVIHYPTTILIDRNGIIVGRDLHGTELEEKIKKIL